MDVQDEVGIPGDDELNEGMKVGGVAEGVTPLGVKMFFPGLSNAAYAAAGKDIYRDYTLKDFAGNPGKMNWIMAPLSQQFQNPVFPIFVSLQPHLPY